MVKLTNLRPSKALGIDPDDMVAVGMNCLPGATAETRLLPRRSPPRPGNLLAMADGRPGLSWISHDERSEAGPHAPALIPGGGAPVNR